MTFRKSKLIDNWRSWLALNIHWKFRNTMLLSPKPLVMSAIAELTPKKKIGRGRKLLSPSVRDNCHSCVKFGSLWQPPTQTFLGGSSRVPSCSCLRGRLSVWGIMLEPKTCFSRQSTQEFDVILTKCEKVGLPVEYCEPWISRTEFVVLVEGKSEPFISCICLCQVPCLVLKTRRVKVKRDPSARFKRCLPTSVSLPD